MTLLADRAVVFSKSAEASAFDIACPECHAPRLGQCRRDDGRAKPICTERFVAGADAIAAVDAERAAEYEALLAVARCDDDEDADEPSPRAKQAASMRRVHAERREREAMARAARFLADSAETADDGSADRLVAGTVAIARLRETLKPPTIDVEPTEPEQVVAVDYVGRRAAAVERLASYVQRRRAREATAARIAELTFAIAAAEAELRRVNAANAARAAARDMRLGRAGFRAAREAARLDRQRAEREARAERIARGDDVARVKPPPAQPVNASVGAGAGTGGRSSSKRSKKAARRAAARRRR